MKGLCCEKGKKSNFDIHIHYLIALIYLFFWISLIISVMTNSYDDCISRSYGKHKTGSLDTTPVLSLNPHPCPCPHQPTLNKL